MYIKIRGYKSKVSHHRHVCYCSCTNNNVHVTCTHTNGYHISLSNKANVSCTKCHRLHIGKVFLGYAVKAYRGSKGIAPPILNLGTKRKRVTNFTPPPAPGARTAVPVEKGAGWTPETVWTFWRRAKCLASSGIGTPDHPGRTIVTTVTELSRLKFYTQH